jgi:SAM-dependent methyltransferase
VSEPNPLYDDPVLARAYARVSAANLYNAAYERPAVQDVLGDMCDRDVLDAGCAGGEHSAWLVERGARVVALDSSAAMVRLAGERLGASARVLQGDLAQPLALPDAAFDVVLCSLTLHYLENWQAPLGEFHRVLRPSGRLVISTHHPFVMLEMVGDYHVLQRVDDAFTNFADAPVPVRYYHRSLERIVAEVRGAGFAIRALREPLPHADADALDPKRAARLRTQPWFLIVDAEAEPR